jgi:hypothetical protein
MPLPKWQVVENVVAAIERSHASVPGMRIIQKAVLLQRRGRQYPREVDVLVERPTDDRVERTGIDVKNERRPIDVEMLEGLAAKRKKLDLDCYVVVSTSGDSAAAKVGVHEHHGDGAAASCPHLPP